MLEQFKNDLLNLGKLKIVSSFYADPTVDKRPVADADRQCRRPESHSGYCEIVIVVDGECEILFGDHVWKAGPGVAFLIDGGDVHQGVYPQDDRPGFHLWMHIMPEHMIYSLWYNTGSGYRYVKKVSGYHHYDPHGQKALIAVWEKTREHRGGIEYLTELSLWLQLRAARLVQLYSEMETFDSYNPEKSNRFRIEQIMDYIDVQCGRDCSIATLVRMAGCSRTNFLRNFRRYAGCSVLEYVNRQRIQRYKSLLKPSYKSLQSTPLKTCAQELGFSSPQAFARWRKQHLDELPPKPEKGK